MNKLGDFIFGGVGELAIAGLTFIGFASVAALLIALSDAFGTNIVAVTLIAAVVFIIGGTSHVNNKWY